MTLLRRAIASTTVVLLAPSMLAACSESDDESGGDGARATGIPEEWYVTAKEELAEAPDPQAAVPTVELGGTCELVSSVEIAGGAAEPYGTGASTLDGSGTRYFCQFSEPSLDLVIVQASDEASYSELQESAHASEQVGNVQTEQTLTSGAREILVKKTVYPTNDSHIDYAAYYFDDDNLGTALLEVETTDTRGLIESYDEQ